MTLPTPTTSTIDDVKNKPQNEPDAHDEQQGIDNPRKIKCRNAVTIQRNVLAKYFKNNIYQYSTYLCLMPNELA